MGSFFSALFEELGARRMRLRAALSDRGASLLEFLILLGLLLGFLAPVLFPFGPVPGWWPMALLGLWIVAYALLDARRQAGLRAAEADEGRQAGLQRSYDRLALLVGVGLPALGAVAFAVAALAPPPGGGDFTPPPDAIAVDLVK